MSTTLRRSLVPLSDGTLLNLFTTDHATKLYGQICSAEGQPIGAEFLIQSVTSGEIVEPGATALSNGRFAVSWMHNTDSLGAYQLETRLCGVGGANLGSVVRIGSLFSSYGEMASLAGGGYTITYLNDGTHGVVFSDAGVMGTPFNLENTSGYEVAALTGGGFVNVLQLSSNGTDAEIKAFLRKPNGSTAVIDVVPAGTAGEADVVGLANGNFVILWREGLGTGNALKARILNPEGGAVGGVLTLYQGAAVTVEEASIKPLINGGFALAFTGLGADRDVYLGTYSGTGAAVQAPAVVGQHTTGHQSGPQINVLKDGRLLFAWEDADAAGARFQVFDPRTAGVAVTGGATNDRYVGSRYGDTLNGGSGSDTLIGGLGNDVFYVGSSGDRVVETSGGGTADLVYSSIGYALPAYVENVAATGSGAISLTGNGLANTMTGNAARNTLKGGSGNDKLNGSRGNDLLYGGAGYDKFVFNTGLSSSSNKDRIADWSARYDTICLENAIFKALKATGKLGSGFFTIAAKAGDANDYVGYNRATGDLWYDPNGSKPGGQVIFANIGPNKLIAAGDFLVT